MARWWNRAMAKLYGAFPDLAERWGRRSAATGGEIPWTPLKKPLRETVWTVVTTGGLHLASDTPFDMGDPAGDPTWRALPTDAPPEALAITHDYYDHADARRDLNLVFPVERLREMAGRGVIAGLSPTAYGLMGHIDGPLVDVLVRATAPEIARRIRASGVDAVLLVPA